MATETELTEALKSPDSESGPSVQVTRNKSPPESASKFILKLVLICAVILALGVGVCLALVFTMSDDSQTWPRTCQNDTNQRLFSAQETQFYFSQSIEPWTIAETQCQSILGPEAGLVSLDDQEVQDFVIENVVGIEKVSDFWSGGRLYELEWLWATGNSSLANQDWANDQTTNVEGKSMCLNVELGAPDDAGSEWVVRECNFPSHYVCQSQCNRPEPE